MSWAVAPFLFNGRPVSLQASHRPALDAAVLAADVWAYVEHHIRGLTTPEAARAKFFWSQAERFAASLRSERYEASPLHLYYMMLNAAKALILIRDPAGSSQFRTHGLAYDLSLPAQSNSAHLPGNLHAKPAGVFVSLCAVMGDQPVNQPLEDLFGSVISIHRAYSTIRQAPRERFMPLSKPVRLFAFGDGRFVSEIANHVDLTEVRAALPTEWQTQSSPDWSDKGVQSTNSIALAKVGANQAFTDFYTAIRRQVDVIVGRNGLYYYLRRSDTPPVAWSQITLNYSIGLALSSLARYHPDVLNDQYNSPNGWLIKEYLRIAPHQFLALIAAEITGRIIQTPYGDLS